ncbi:ATP-grasp domain-containing protein [Pontibacter diazotrophicus]|uniref:ATP-grasp domain-containing protein n=1 Tax=Pontibacter diazotrophicus TaxID=1400979 RepID=A0A3D8LFB8_9BACT|nr:ATP-grasp domain-containing protein [Pontibacter diazotrophicus]RDV16141.1 ATP-grasp domain-containing protein [Pontibacter diazotrophicus]
MKKILVTGAGSLLGQGILRCLNNSSNPYYIITADPDFRAPGHSLGDKAYTSRMANDPQFLSELEKIIEKEQVDAMFVGIDQELPLVSENKRRLEEQYGVKVIVSGPDVIAISNDKWLTAEFLRENGFPYPQSALTTDRGGIEKLRQSCSYPFIAKPVDGARSMGIKIIKGDEDLQHVCSYPNNLVVQEMLSEEEGEFTAGTMVIDGKCRAIVSLKRDLKDGNTYRAYRDGDNPYDATISSIAERLGVEGPANFQYRIKDGKPVVFEINGRFSGTTPLRYMFGFNEVEALLNHLFGVEEMKQPQLRNGAVFRAWADIFVENEQLNELQEKGVLEGYRSQYYPFKNK